MPGSDRPRRWHGPLVIGALVVLACCGLIAARVVWFDAYWLFREKPPWLAATQGRNKLLDRQMRRAKVLQAMTREYETVFFGSSTTYHGLDPADADPGPRIYNAGISGILADELPVMAGIIASRPLLKRVALGLDYYMFSRTEGTVRLDRALATPIGRANALLGSFIGRYAIQDAWPRAVEAKTDPGRWTYEGFRVTPKLAADETMVNDAVRRRTTVPLQPSTYASLERTLDILRGRDVDVYLAPVSRAQRRVMSDLGVGDDFARWREDMRALAMRRGIRFHDLTALGSDDAFDPTSGSTDLWLDNLHYTPAIGRRVLGALGLRSRP